MLKKVVVKNLRSIKKAELTFDKSGIEYRNKYVFKNNHVNPVTLYGDNGSGKSQFLLAFKTLVFLMNYSNVNESQIDVLIDLLNISFLDNSNPIKENSQFKLPQLSFSFECDDGFSFEYEVGLISINNILSESLCINGSCVLKRTAGTYILFDKEENKVATNYSAVRKVGIEEYNDNSPYLDIKRCYDVMRKIIYISDELSVIGSKMSLISPQDALIKNQINEYIERFSATPSFKFFEKLELNGEKTLYCDYGNNQILPFIAQSDGIKRESYILSALSMSCEDDCLVVVDELNRSIHPLNTIKIIDEFVKKGVQLLFSCHDTNLLRYLRPDQVYLCYFNDLYTSIYRLNEIHPNIREINNIESMYLKGMFDHKK